MVFNGEGCATIHLHRVSGEINYDEEGKENEKKKRSPDLANNDCTSVPIRGGLRERKTE